MNKRYFNIHKGNFIAQLRKMHKDWIQEGASPCLSSLRSTAFTSDQVFLRLQHRLLLLRQQLHQCWQEGTRQALQTPQEDQLYTPPSPSAIQVQPVTLTFSPCSLETCLLSFASHLFPRIIFSTSGEACWDRNRWKKGLLLMSYKYCQKMRCPSRT